MCVVFFSLSLVIIVFLFCHSAWCLFPLLLTLFVHAALFLFTVNIRCSIQYTYKGESGKKREWAWDIEGAEKKNLNAKHANAFRAHYLVLKPTHSPPSLFDAKHVFDAFLNNRLRFSFVCVCLCNVLCSGISFPLLRFFPHYLFLSATVILRT